jgi:uncharacterized protein (TIGR03435 family)
MNCPLELLIEAAYGVDGNQLVGMPSWAKDARYDVNAKVDTAEVMQLQRLNRQQRFDMLQPVLAERFLLKTHHETREMTALALVLDRHGPRLRPAVPGNTYADGIKGADGQPVGPALLLRDGQLIGQAASVEALRQLLANSLHRVVIDRTGLQGKYDFTIPWPPQMVDLADSTSPSIFTVIQELGLKLESHRTGVEVLVIDHLSPPSAN